MNAPNSDPRPDPRTAFRPQTTADTIAARLRARLLDGGFVPGEPISIRRIAEAEGISVIPARDALRGLVAEGALEFRDARTIVVPPLDAGTLGEIRHARLAIEGELADRAFPALAGMADRLAGIDAEVTAALTARDVPGYMRTNRALHFTIYDKAGAPVLLALADLLWLRFAPSMRIVCDAFDGQPPRADHHVGAIEALRMGHRHAFRAAIETDISQGMDMLLDHANRASADAAATRGIT
jgi:DNA-binding GntR family transcriptional regulator